MSDTKTLLDLAWEKFGKNDFEGSIALAKEHLENTEPAVRSEAKKIIALSNFRQLKFNESEKIFTELANGSENSDDWFNVVTSAALNKNLTLSKTAFDNAVHFYQTNPTKDNLSIPYMAFYYTLALRDIKEYQRAFEQLGLLRDVFANVGITDSHFLYVRGIPSFQTTLKEAKLIFENNNGEEVTAFFVHLKNKVDEEGAVFIDEYMATLNLNTK